MFRSLHSFTRREISRNGYPLSFRSGLIFGSVDSEHVAAVRAVAGVDVGDAGVGEQRADDLLDVARADELCPLDFILPVVGAQDDVMMRELGGVGRRVRRR